MRYDGNDLAKEKKLCVFTAAVIQPKFSRLPRFFYSAKILDGDWSISGITVFNWFIFAE
jgi:hypothetical protein